MGSVGGVVAQPALGLTVDLFGCGGSYVVSAGVQTLALPFILLARLENAASDPIVGGEDGAAVAPPPT